MLDCFNFDKFPMLKDVYKKYKDLKHKATKLSGKATSKYDEAAEKRDEFGKKVFAKAIYDVFSEIKPAVFNTDKEETVEWDSLFGKTFESISDRECKFLIGLLERNYIYELPAEYYND